MTTTRTRRTARNRRATVLAVATLLIGIGVVAAMMASSRPSSSAQAHPAPEFTLPDTTGGSVSLSDFRGRNVVLYFSEGAGCGSCLQQMTAIEQNRAAFEQAGVTVLPIVMNSRDQIQSEMSRYGVTTPFLLDDGRVASSYGTLGRGMHEGLPGHSFVLVDAGGVQRWYGEYPSMWLAPGELLRQVSSHLAS